MRSMIFLLVLFLGCSDGARGASSVASPAGAEIRWNAISGSSGYRSEGTGDPRSDAGGTISINSIGTATGPFGGVITSLDLTSYRGREVELSAALEVIEGTGSAAVWVRADSEGRRPAFATSAAMPVVRGEPQIRRVRLYVPVDSSKLVLGAVVKGEASARFSRLRLEGLALTTSEVSAYDVVEAAFGLVEKNALHAPRTDLASLRKHALTPELHDAPSMEAYQRIAVLLKALGDRHSFALPPSQAAESRGAGRATNVVESRLIGRVGYIAVPGFVGTGAEPSARFTGEICGALTQLAPEAVVGWVVDLRQNTGGNMWPMLSGLKPLLGAGSYGSFRDRDGRDTAWATSKLEGCSAPISPDIRVAVLAGPKTASSGEAVVVAFSGRSGSRSFGLATAGLSTANVSLGLPDGGALMLTTAIDVDRNGKAFSEGVVPDVVVVSKAQSDDVLAAALEWLGNL